MTRSTYRLAALASGLFVLLGSLGPAYADGADTVAPAAVAGLSARAGDRLVTLHWTNPSDPDFLGVDVRQSIGATPPSDADHGSLVYSGPGNGVSVTGLTNNATYSFAVFARDAVPNFSAPADITAEPVPAPDTTLKISRSAAATTYGAALTIKGWLLADDATAVAGEPVDVFYRTTGTSAFRGLKRLTTSSTGAVTLAVSPVVTTDYQLVHPDTPFAAASKSDTTTIGVRPRLAARLTPYAIARGGSATIFVGVSPAHPGQPVDLQQLVGGGWQVVQSKTLAANSTTSFLVSPSALGGYTYRVAKAADADHIAATGTALRLSVTRRTLRQGMSGPDVLELQRRLIAAHYDPGAANGSYNYDTKHAVIAFEKVNILHRDGEVDPADWGRLLGTRTTPVLRYPVAGRSIEVDITRQVLLLGESGVVRRILDVSTGSGRLYTVDGVTSRAVTPRGSFRILRKINGVRVSRLGELYRPAYFVGGYAIHGNSSVPAFPASHGCIRIPNPAMDRLFDLLYRGLPVHVYD